MVREVRDEIRAHLDTLRADLLPPQLTRSPLRVLAIGGSDAAIEPDCRRPPWC